MNGKAVYKKPEARSQKLEDNHRAIQFSRNQVEAQDLASLRIGPWIFTVIEKIR
jgi:hypothetical protein